MRTTTEILRLLHNLIRTGSITEVDHDAARARVQSGHNHTDWLPWISSRAGETRTWEAPTVGEQVVLLSPGGDLGQALILTGLFSSERAAPSQDGNEHKRVYPDGTTVTYNHESHHLAVAVPEKGQVTIEVNGHCSVNADTIDLGKPDKLQRSVLGDHMATAMESLIQKINAAQVIGNMGAPTSAIQAVTPIEAPNLVSGGNCYSEQNRNQ